jgi:hypothetical protein
MLALLALAGVAHRLHHILARIMASLAHLGADAAVLVHRGMAAAFFGAGATHLRASRKLRLQRLRPLAAEAQQHRPGGVADIGAVEVEPDALREPLHMLFGKTGVGAGEAGLYAGEARLYAAPDGVHFRRLARMRLQHCRDMMHGWLPVAGPEINRAGMRIVPA